MKNINIKQNQKIYIIGGIVIIIIAFIIFGISNSYAIDSPFGTISIECDNNTIVKGSKATCIIKGSVPANSEVSCLSLEIDLDDDLTLTKFTKASNWLGSIDDNGNPENEGNENKIYLYSEENSTGTFDIGTFEVTAGNSIGNATINLKNVYFYDENYEEKEINNSTYNFEIIANYLNFDDSLTVDEDIEEGIYMISNINGNTSIQTILNKIDTSCTIDVIDNSDNTIAPEFYPMTIKTGFTFNVKYAYGSTVYREVPYKISVKGDVTGTGRPTMGSVMKIAKYINGDEQISGIEYLKAADVTGDDQIKMNDAMKIAKSIVDHSEL